MKPNLLYLGAGYPVLRSKPLQEGGNVAVIKPVAEPEVHPTLHSTNQGAKQDVCALTKSYLSNQEGFHRETNFHGFFTPEDFQTSWNQTKIYPDQEVMNFANQRFPDPSSCEYPRLEGDSSQTKNRFEPKPIVQFKMGFLSFQQAQEEEKWPRKSEDMIQFPKPAKPVLHLPQLEANRSNQLQTKNWRPGDQSSHSEDSSNDQEEPHKSFPCTSHHRIRRILIYNNFPYLDVFTLGAITHQRPSHQSYNVLGSFPSYPGVLRCTSTHHNRRISIQPEDDPGLLKLAKPTSIWESCQPNQFGSDQTFLWKPGDHLGHMEDIQEVFSCTSTREIRRIFIWTNLPYLAATTLLALKEFLEDISQYQRPYSSSRHFLSISWRLLNRGIIQKLSRYKIKRSFPFGMHKSSLTAIFHGAIKAFASKSFISSLFLSLSHFMTVRVCRSRAYKAQFISPL